MRSVRARPRILIAGLMAGAAGCTPFRDAPPAVDVRAVETQLGETVAPDDAYYQAAARAISLRDYARALDYLQAARQKQPDDVRVLNAFGVVYDKLGRFDLSARYYSDAKKLDPASPIVAANQAYSAVLQAQVYGTAVPFEVANAAQSPPAVDSQMAPPMIAVLGQEPARSSSPAAPEQVTRAPAVLPGVPDTAQPAGTAPVVASLPTEARPSITIPDAITASAVVIVEPLTRAANAVEPLASPVVVSPVPVAITPPPIAAAAVSANTSVVPQAPSPVAVNSAPPVVAEPRTRFTIVAPPVSSPALASAAPAQLASHLAPASRSIVPFAPAEKPADPDSAGSAAAKVSAPSAVPPAARASTAPKLASALTPARPSVVPPVPAKESASDSVESAAVKAPFPNVSPRAQADSPVRTRTASAVPPVVSRSVAHPASTGARRSATEAIAAAPAQTNHTKSAASTSPIARIARVVHPAPSARTGSRAPVTSTVMHAASETQAGTKSVTPQTAPPTKKLVLIGKPLFIINASGRSGMSEPVRQRLASLRWTAPSWAVSDGARQSVTTIRYAPIYFIVAHALARTLPFPSRLVACDKQCGGVSLILGRDFLKVRFVKTAAATTKRS